MRVIRGLHNIRPEDRGVAVTLGNYDGVHRGHQALFGQLAQNAPGMRRCAVCFQPQPLEYLHPEQAPVRLQGLADKLRSLRAAGVEQVLVLRFDRVLSSMSAEAFVREVLVKALGARHVIVGDDYRFGHQRQGDVALLRRLADEGGYVVDDLPTVNHDEQRISSTAIRQALAAGQCEAAETLLGRPYQVRGRVVHGQKLGRELGAATANVALRRPSPLKHGVYCVRLNGMPGVANIGFRPTVGGSGVHLEVHLLDGVHQLYDQMVVVDFERFLRGEVKFPDLDSLKTAIAGDVRAAREHFKQDSE